MTGYLKLYLLLAGAYVRSRMEYRVSFVARVTGLIAVYLAEVGGIWVLLTNFGEMAGWRFGEVLFNFSLAILSWGFCVLLFLHFRDLETYVVRGEFDRFLVRPWSPFFQFLASRFELFSLSQFAFSITLFGWANTLVEVRWSLVKVLYLLLAVVGGVLIQGALILIVSAISFWTLRSRQLYHTVVRTTRELAWYPIAIFSRGVQSFLVYVLPLAFINYFPTQFILGKADPTYGPAYQYLSPVVGLAAFAVGLVMWRKGVDKYQGAGS